MPNIVPYSNFHELNLDWVLEKMKELETKVDAFIGSAVPSDDPPEMDGVASAGSSVNYARGDHVHPSDTSRASVSALNDLDTREYNDYVALNADINTVDAKIAFSSAAPVMDGVASPGSSAYQARADHIHPTDTSRASKSEFDTLKATVDAYAGGALPYGLTPEMDGAGSAGIIDAYARGDHSHPSDTSKLDTAGGTITGNLDINGVLDQTKYHIVTSTQAVGWLRIAKVTPISMECTLRIIRNPAGANGEFHMIRFIKCRNFFSQFRDENSAIGGALAIDKIRYTNAEYLDVHINSNEWANLSIMMERIANSKAADADVELITPEWVADTPDGETVLRTYYFLDSTKGAFTAAAFGKTWTFRKGGSDFATLEVTQTLTAADAVPAGYTIITNLPLGWRPYADILFPCANNNTDLMYVQVQANGNVRFYTDAAITADTDAAFTAAWLTRNSL